jgi:para-aminobenzoate synthetase component 1
MTFCFNYLCSVIISISDLAAFKQKALTWATGFDVACYLDSNNFNDLYSKFEALIAVDVKEELSVNSGNAFEQLEEFRAKHKGWITGFFGYDLKNEIESLSSNNQDILDFPDLYFFTPKHLILIKENEAEIISDNAERILAEINKTDSNTIDVTTPAVNLKSRFDKEDYIATANKVKEHIARGDIYVTNFCQEFYADNAQIDPLQTFLSLNSISPNPFSCFFKLRDNYILCASPERFLAKRGEKLVSQPIKGTAKRSADKIQDELNKRSLTLHTKELQENVMIVDLVRNDLTRSARPGTVKTEELFGIYTFNQLHHMISTVACDINEHTTAIQAIKNTFPMGSMTGAPKVSAMRLMEEFERSKRGVYSGAMGYFGPDDDFDFNVVIRTLLYNEGKQYLSFQTGSAITFNADAEKEYEECLLKAKAVLEVLGG